MAIPFTNKWARERARKEFDLYLKNREISVRGLGRVRVTKLDTFNGYGWIQTIKAKRGKKIFTVDAGNITAISDKLKKVM